MIEDHAAADHKGVLIQQGVWDAVRVTMNGLLACLALRQVLKANQWQDLMKPGRHQKPPQSLVVWIIYWHAHRVCHHRALDMRLVLGSGMYSPEYRCNTKI